MQYPRSQTCVRAVGLALALASTTYAQTLTGLSSDSGLTSVPGLRTVTNGDELIRIGATEGRTTVFVFQLPDFGAVANPFATATLSFVLLENGPNVLSGFVSSGGITPTFNADLYGIDARDTSAVLTSDAYFSADEQTVGASLLQADFLTSATAVGTVSFSGASLTSYLNSEYASGAGAGDFVFFRLNPDSVAGTGISNNQRYRVAMQDNATFDDPLISYTAIPEPSAYAALAGLGGLALALGRRRRDR